MQPESPCRRSPAHPPPIERFNQPVVVHVTVCAKHRINLFANALTCRALLDAWSEAVQWRVCTYVVMPDHIHLFCIPGVHSPEPVKRWAAYWKKQAGLSDPRLKGQWLRGVWDTQMRNEEHYAEKLFYVRQNPVRAELVSATEDWPYSGSLHEIQW